ncbi:MarR family winged helix-turn-helix transcriptional regulator [Actinomadura madurae]|uniref:MarR family winged helix-turn-helix transcriptional regulator n=1 Tax=Actinomadura madurae TaxID=1993 RepID=UPI0020D24F43|nr:MarR family transcriptional regulator [Actinomadura madurae]MCP9953177.1 MarR family transcriptional regulator [Actinomadura madurae]MCP9969939.1 MarR family transcriptional regulator [Actinomadura madurae]MCP9982390.1 MarR family transcriptional regulator [Actinomadura madurae]MCQ0006082.1 MarR family transcriptional regulator [Actinomadura madurae]MCQ0018637.1 MarR family transcriptional regulator [Actinomadura madurae]
MGYTRGMDEQMDRDVCKLVHKFAQRLDVHVRRIADEVGMTASQVVALRELSEPITARELAHRMACEASNATFVLDRLEGQGLVERRPHPTDRRAKQIVLTPEGERARAGVVERLSAHSPLTPLSPAEQDSLRDLLQALLAEPV